HLTLSFAPDGTAIAGHQSNLFQTLNQQQSTAAWQQQILQAFQSWEVNTNVNIGVVTDGGQAFCIGGLTQGDPRFGDIRIGAQAMAAEVLWISVPFDPTFSGTWVGDVLFNSSNVTAANLYPAALHEAGHALRLEESTDPDSPMFSKLNSITTLTS